MDENEKIVDLVDSSDKIIGTIPRGKGISLDPEGGHYIRFVAVLVTNQEDKIWFSTRSLQSFIAPGGLDNSAEGHMPTGESYEECALRKLMEETAIVATVDQLEELTHVKFPGLPYFCKYFLLRTNQQPRISNEHTAGEWLTLEEARHAIASAEHKAKETVRYAVELLEKHKTAEGKL